MYAVVPLSWPKSSARSGSTPPSPPPAGCPYDLADVYLFRGHVREGRPDSGTVALWTMLRNHDERVRASSYLNGGTVSNGVPTGVASPRSAEYPLAGVGFTVRRA